MKNIKLSDGKLSKVDDDVFDFINKFKWYYDGKYARRTSDGIRMHRFIMEIYNKDLIIDHINGNRLDNRKSNLRISTHSLNSQNRTLKPGLGTYFNKQRGKWAAEITRDRKKKFLGYYSDREMAEKAYRKERSKYIV